MKEKLNELIKNAYSPYYKFPVAAIIEMKDGKLFYGVNVETSAPASGICAERNALFSAMAAGYKKGQVKTIYIMNTTDKACYPCFICRQALSDLCDKDTTIITYNNQGESQSVLLEALCPYPFADEDLA